MVKEEFIADLMSLMLFYLINQIVNFDYFHFEKVDFFMVKIFFVFIKNIDLIVTFVDGFINFNDFLKINYQ